MISIFRFLKCTSGVTAVEYAMIAAAIALTLVVAMPLINASLTTSYTNVSDNLN